MSIILRIDVDSAYGRKSLARHLLSRIKSDFYFPRILSFGYLVDLLTILKMLNFHNANAFVFFRKCTLPTAHVTMLLKRGGHSIGLHLENSRSYNTFIRELRYFEKYFGMKIVSFSKHGSGKYKYGLFHYPPYEPKKYITWGKEAGMVFFLGNDEDPSIRDYIDGEMHIFPSAYWLEPFWRKTEVFNLEWLKLESKKRDIVLLFHPDNVTHNEHLANELSIILKTLPIKSLSEIISV